MRKIDILIVEDDAGILDVLTLYLSQEEKNRTVVPARTLAEATKLISEKRYDLILLDLWLDGQYAAPLITLTEKLYPSNPPSICVMSAAQGAEKIVAKFKFCKFVAKPFTLEQLDEVLDLLTKN